jgi:hypothetical protein
MQQEILANLDNPAQLERLYRTDKTSFKHAFNALYPTVSYDTILDFWNERLNYSREEISWGNRKELVFVIVLSLVAGIIAKLPAVLGVDQESFYMRNIGFIILPILSIYFAWKNKLSRGKIAFIAGTTIAAAVFINTVPASKSDTLLLACIHLPLFLWSVLGFAFVGDFNINDEKRLGFLKFNGDLVVMTTLIVIAAGILSGITIGLFSLIGINIENFYFQNIVVFGLPAAPIIGTYLIQTNPQLVGKVSPVIAKIFSPLVLVMLVIYLAAMFYSGKDPYNDREFLMVFNALLIGVMAIIFFSVAGTSGTSKSHTETWILFLLSLVTIVVNGIALSAIIFRISEWGLSPNRLAVLGANLLMLGNLLVETTQIFRVLSNKTNIDSVGKSIAYYLTIYFIWVIIVTFIFPSIFQV